jgi:hypothetical protein
MNDKEQAVLDAARAYLESVDAGGVGDACDTIILLRRAVVAHDSPIPSDADLCTIYRTTPRLTTTGTEGFRAIYARACRDCADAYEEWDGTDPELMDTFRTWAEEVESL